MTRSLLLRSVAAAAATTAISLAAVSSASAAAPIPVKPSASCKVPVFSVSTTSAMPGSKVTVSGQNFSGCAAQGNPAKPTAVLTVKVGILTAAKVKEVLATTKTSANGSFSVQITLPTVSAGGEPKIALAAESDDPVTKLVYTGFATVVYHVPAPTTTAAPTTATPTTATPTSSASSTAEPTSATSSTDVPTAVPAGTGGLAAPTSSAQIDTEIGVGLAGAALIALGGFGMARRRSRQH